MKYNNDSTEDEYGNWFELSYSGIYIYIYNYPIKFMVLWWGIYSYLNNELIKIGDIDIMTAAHGSSGSFGSRLR